MRVLVLLYGSRGDIQPGVSAALELQRRGHEVAVGAPPQSVDFITKTGVEARKFGPDLSAFYSSPDKQKTLASGNFLKLLALTLEGMEEHNDQMADELIAISRDAEMIVTTQVPEPWAQVLSEARQIPIVTLHTFPYRRNKAYPPYSTVPPHWRVPGFANNAGWALYERTIGSLYRRQTSALRAKLGLPPSNESCASLFAKAGVPEVQIYAQALAPGLAESWGPRRPFAGFLEFPRSAREAVGELADQHSDIVDWVRDGAPPLYFGLGSMPVADIDETVRSVREVCGSLGQRVLIGVRKAPQGQDALPTEPDLKVVGPFAHDLVFPHCRAAVHHGGVGTLFEGLRAGLPTLVCSVAWDQPFWGARVTNLGIGAHLPYRQLDGQKLQAALRVVLAPETAARAQEFGKRLNEAPDGVPSVCDIVEDTASSFTALRA
ncbi:MAG: glycosyltransferase [Segniliparus sp.]|uniref:glycosyltransferase n=1 Tax=Segniliparus sp. TaxID=2804064 RepID=UPI003F4097D8